MSDSINATELAVWWRAIVFHADNDNIAKVQAYRHHVHGVPRNLLAGALMKKEVDEFILSMKVHTLKRCISTLEKKRKEKATTAGSSIRHITWSDMISVRSKSGNKSDREAILQKVENRMKEMSATVEDSSLLQEAAWNWVGSHLEDYDGRFEKNLRNPDMDKMAIWNELVSTWETCKGFQDEIPQLEAHLEQCMAKFKAKRGILKFRT